ncbi:hypothetical protein DICVIV_09391 [Dictyocaulus viviparus]|uniref:Uncharacterized protein n=1 Tax=Dictyocaulus viviparus TaxID=29172 RepID=A0A0D8XQC1_DICVI|nr:hypothetical protein DICVIV_09391 [Dictyocaulus viviparus]
MDGSRKRRRKSLGIQFEKQHSEESFVLPKPTSSTRSRHSATRRWYSPSPENRPLTKMKSSVTISHSKGKQQRQRMEFDFSKLPPEYDATSFVILESLKWDATEFVLHKEIRKSNPKTPVKIGSASMNMSSNYSIEIKEEVTKESSDEDEKVTVVRMADIGAAPFTPTPISTSPFSTPTKYRKRCKLSQPVIKLPRRKSLGIATRVAGADLPLVRPVVSEQQLSVSENTVSSSSVEQTCSKSSDLDNVSNDSGSVDASNSSSRVEGRHSVKLCNKEHSYAMYIGILIGERLRKGSPTSTRRPKRCSAGRSRNFFAEDSVVSSTNFDSSSGNSSSVIESSANPETAAHGIQEKSLEHEFSGSEILSDATPNHEGLIETSEDPEAKNIVAPMLASCHSTSMESVACVEEGEQISDLEKANLTIKSKKRSVSVKTTGAGKVRIAPPGGNVFSTTSRQSSTLKSVRRSSRGHILTAKLRDFEVESKLHESWKPSKRVDPNSALSILRRVSKYTRPPRSPSPQLLETLVPDHDEYIEPEASHDVITSKGENPEGTTLVVFWFMLHSYLTQKLTRERFRTKT